MRGPGRSRRCRDYVAALDVLGHTALPGAHRATHLRVPGVVLLKAACICLQRQVEDVVRFSE